jgi:hypothetical protein
VANPQVELDMAHKAVEYAGKGRSKAIHEEAGNRCFG